MGKIIAFSGYRSEKLPENIDPIRINLRETVLLSIEEGFDTFLCGMADGFDLMAANIVLELKPQYNLKLVSVIPFEDNAAKSEAYTKVLSNADDKVVLSKAYAKLPDWFKIDTPLGSYNPDWAVLIEKDSEKKLYFVIETKGSIQIDMLRPAEYDKIHCGMKHFEALNNNVTYKAVDDFDKFIESI